VFWIELLRLELKKKLNLSGKKITHFENNYLRLKKNDVLPFHSNGMKFAAYGHNGSEIFSNIYYSIGGGFILQESETSSTGAPKEVRNVPYPYHTATELMQICKDTKLNVYEVQFENEKALGRTESQIIDGLNDLWKVMNYSIDRGIESKELYLPGGLNVKRRAPIIFKKLIERSKTKVSERQITPNEVEGSGNLSVLVMDWVSLYACAVNEENAAGGRIVTAPTNGAAGVIPACLRYYIKWVGNKENEKKKMLLHFY